MAREKLAEKGSSSHSSSSSNSNYNSSAGQQTKSKGQQQQQQQQQRGKQQQPQQQQSRGQGHSVNQSSQKGGCFGCGRLNHVRGDCRFKDHPEFNSGESVAWRDSTMGKKWASSGKKDAKGNVSEVLPAKDTLTGDSSYEPPSMPTPSGSKNKGMFDADDAVEVSQRRIR